MKLQEEDYLFDTEFSLATKIIRNDFQDKQHGSLNPPIYMTSTFAMKSPEEYTSHYYYTRYGNPTATAYVDVLAKIENNNYGITFASGTAAMVCVLGLLGTGDHMITGDDIYGGNSSYFRNIAEKKHKIEVEFVDMSVVGNVVNSIKENTKLIWIETPSNPTLKLVDLQALCQIAKEKHIITVVDNTFSSPYLQTPSDFGVDITVNSGSKYLGGHSDVIFGTLTCKEKALYDQLHFLAYTHGGCTSPQDCYLMLRSLKTLEVRMKQQVKNAFAVATFLEKHKMVQKVLYPGLKSHPQYELAKRQMRGGGAMVSVYLKANKEKTRQFLMNLNMFTLAVSLGGVESLVEIPATMTHNNVPEESRLKVGITDSLVRISVGLESIKDLLEDLNNALKSIE